MDAATDEANNRVTIDFMRQQVEVRNSKDDWTGVTSTAARRKLQNRLNQRAYRRRQIQLRDRIAARRIEEKSDIISQQSGDVQRRGTSSPPMSSSPAEAKITQPHSYVPTQRVCTMNRPWRQAKVRRLVDETLAEYLVGTLRPARLPTLIQINVFNALLRNAAALRVGAEWLLCDAISPFNLVGPGLGRGSPAIVAMTEAPCPESLRPTALQLEVPHHPWIDLIPVPRLRDNILRSIEDVAICDEDVLCYDLVEVSSEADKASLVVWGDPWDPRSWEASTAFLQKWAWLLEGCQELLETTNRWREKRGERRLDFGFITNYT